MKPAMWCLTAILVCLLVEVPLDGVPDTNTDDANTTATSPIERFLTRQEPPLREYRAHRTLRAVNRRFRAAENPSFWTSRVEVVRQYARIGGVRVPVLTSVAHVKIAGRSEFEMTYRYESINGQSLTR